MLAGAAMALREKSSAASRAGSKRQERMTTPGKASGKGQVASKGLQQAGWFEVMAAFCPGAAESASRVAVYICLQMANKAKRKPCHGFCQTSRAFLLERR
ncbi:hypothetical protein D9M72_240450 [compost metagenome]